MKKILVNSSLSVLCCLMLTSCNNAKDTKIEPAQNNAPEAQDAAATTKHANNIIELSEKNPKITPDQFKDYIKNAGKNVVVKFYAEWCGPCRQMTSTIKGLAADFTHITFIEVNIDIFGDLAQAYNVHSLPTLFYFKDGVQQGKAEAGFKQTEEFKSKLRSAFGN